MTKQHRNKQAIHRVLTVISAQIAKLTRKREKTSDLCSQLTVKHTCHQCHNTSLNDKQANTLNTKMGHTVYSLKRYETSTIDQRLVSTVYLKFKSVDWATRAQIRHSWELNSNWSRFLKRLAVEQPSHSRWQYKKHKNLTTLFI